MFFILIDFITSNLDREKILGNIKKELREEGVTG